MTGEQLYERWTAVWAEMRNPVPAWDELYDDERNAWADLAQQLDADAPADEARVERLRKALAAAKSALLCAEPMTDELREYIDTALGGGER